MAKYFLQRRLIPVAALIAGLLGPGILSADLKDAAPASSYLAIYGKHNPERDYQKQYYAEIWNTVQETRICERALQILQSNIGEADAQKFLDVKDAITTALEPVDWEKLGNTSEVMYAQRMVAPTSQHVLLARIPDDGAKSLLTGVQNLFKLAVDASDGKLTIGTRTIGGVELTALELPSEVPFQPLVGVKDDVFIFASSEAFATESLSLLKDPSGQSKFDDARVTEALRQLPAAEDSIVFFDGRMLFSQMGGLGDFIRTVSRGNEDAERVAGLLTKFIGQMDAVDYELTVEYTEGFQNRSAAFGRLRDGADETVLGKMLVNQQPFDNWSRWVPATASSYSLWSGVNLHPLYEWVTTEIPETFPETRQGFDRFAQLQKEFDLHLDADLLQAFGGEMVSLTFPGKTPTPFGQSTESVFFARCTEPERIQELLHRGINALNEIPQLKGQGLGLKDAAGLKGFEELTANMLGMMGVRPVIGFRDGWMVIGSHKSAVEQALKTQAGESDSIVTTDRFTQFDLTVDGPVYGISYTNNAEQTRQIAAALQQAGMMLPMIIGMAGGQNHGGPELAVVQDIAGLLPSIGKIIGKFDFIQSTLSTTVAGPTDGTWMRKSVTLIRDPAAAASSATSAGAASDVKPPTAAAPVKLKPEGESPGTPRPEKK